MPAFIISRNVSSLSQAGPIVQTIFVRLYMQSSNYTLRLRVFSFSGAL